MGEPRGPIIKSGGYAAPAWSAWSASGDALAECAFIRSSLLTFGGRPESGS
jgi:hypothetical protein